MPNNTDLHTLLQDHFDYNGARLKFTALFILALIKLTTVNWTKLANALNGKAHKKSNYRRIQRFFAGFDLKIERVARLVLWLLPLKTGFVISIDRTNWEFGQSSINILMASIVYEGTAFPLYWMMLSKRGNSNTKERKDLMQAVLRLIDPGAIAAVVGDREFIGQPWFAYLDNAHLPYFMRIRENALVRVRGQKKPIKTVFADLVVGQRRLLRKPRVIYGTRVYVSGVRLPNAKDGSREYLIVVSNQKGSCALSVYRRRWGIEVLFSALKTRGFDLEATHVTDPDRLAKLVSFLAIAFSWAHRVGQWLNEQEPLKRKKHGGKERSLFRYGLDHLQYVLLNLAEHGQTLERCLAFFVKPPWLPQNALT